MVCVLKNRPGASLVEILVTVLIIAVSMLIIMAFSRNTFFMSKDSRGSEAASLSAEDKLAELAALPFPAASGDDKDTIDNIICTRNWTVKDTAFIKRAIVKISFKSLKGTERELTFSGAIN